MRTQLFIFVGVEKNAVVKYGDSIVPQSDQISSPPAAEEKKHVAVSGMGMFVNDWQTDSKKGVRKPVHRKNVSLIKIKVKVC